MNDLISRAAALRIFEEHCYPVRYDHNSIERGMTLPGIVEVLNITPSAQPETAKRIVGKSRDGMTLWYHCDMCNEPVDAQDNFCRGCGRRLTDG